MTLLTSIVLLIFNGWAAELPVQAQEKIFPQQSIPRDSLVSGWYYIYENESGIKRQLENTDQYFFIDPVPIVTAKNFNMLEIYESEYAGKKFSGLSIYMDDRGAENWSQATKKLVGKQLAFVLENKLIYVSKVYSQITNGLAALNRGDHTRKELEKIKMILEKERTAN